MSGMGRDVHGHPSGGDDRPQQLRRPADPTMDELSKRMNKMDPYGNDYGRYSYNLQMPRPAPNADGWSSGENHFDYQAYGHPGAHQLSYQQTGWNPTASEFVPKSNLSAAAQEFVPRQMPRNTSWAYQQQQLQQQSEELMYQHHHQQAQEAAAASQYQQSNQGYGYRAPPPASSAPSASASSSNQMGQVAASRPPPPPQDSMYDPTDALTDAVATIILMPHKFERTSMQLAEKINNSVSDVKSLTNLAVLLVDTCLKKKDFQSMAGKFCDDLAQKVAVSFDGATFKQQLLETYQNLHGEHVQLLSSNANRCRSLLVFATDLYLQMKEDAEAEAEAEPSGDAAAAAAAPDPAKRVRSQLLANLVYQLFMSFLTLGKQDEKNLLLVADMLKLSGENLESDEMKNKGSMENMDQIMGLVGSVAGEGRTAEAARTSFTRLLEIRSNRWQFEASERPSVFDVPETKPSGRVKGSNAIAIVQPPVAAPQPATKTIRSSVPAKSAAPGGKLAPEDQELTEEELRFMSEQLGDETFSESDGTVGTDADGNGVSDSDMPEEVEAAYQQFLEEQHQRKQSNGH